MHTPVLLETVVESLAVIPNGRYIDATVGEAGHTYALLHQRAHVLAIDQDAWQIDQLKMNLNDPRLKLVVGNFGNLFEIAKINRFYPVDGILFDLGLSMNQLTKSGRGFSYEALNDPLDMRLDKDNTTKAADLLKLFTVEKLYHMLAANAEEIYASHIAHAIVQRRSRHPIVRVKDLLFVIDRVVGRQDKRCYSRVFQAIRVEVNSEFTNLKKGLTDSLRLIKPNGRIAVLSFHSLEDRIVKQFIKNNNLKQLNKKPLKAIGGRNFERSAKLRVFSL